MTRSKRKEKGILVIAEVLEEFLSWLKMRFLGTNIFLFSLLLIYLL